MAKAKTYELDEQVLSDTQVKATGQAQLIISSLSNKHPQTAQQIADDIKAKLQTRQDPLRVVSFYLSTWKKSGLIKVVGVVEGETPVSTGGSKETVKAADVAKVEAPVQDDPFADNSTPADYEDEKPNADEFDYVNAPLGEAVVHLLGNFADPASSKMISDELNVLGRTVSPKQVSDAARRLQEKKRIAKKDDGFVLA